MKIRHSFNITDSSLRSFSFFLSLVVLIIVSCTRKTESYSIIEFTGVKEVINYSKSFLLMKNVSDSINPVPIAASKGDLFACDEYPFLYTGGSSLNSYSFNPTDSVLYVNGKIYSIEIPGNDNMIPWFNDSIDRDYSGLQFISMVSGLPESYIPHLRRLAEIKPDAGLWSEGRFSDMAEFLKIFKPKVIAGPTLYQSDYDSLSRQTELEFLLASIGDSVITDPLPALPGLKQIFLMDLDDDFVYTNDFLQNNRQIEKVTINKSGTFDFAVINPLENLKELIVSGSDSILNFDLLNSHKKLEILSITGSEPGFNPALLNLPSLRWMTFSSNVTQNEFDNFIKAHPGLEIVELIANDTLSSLQSLSGLKNLTGLTVTDTLKDVASIKTLKNLKYLSLPAGFLKESINKAQIQEALPGARIAANEGFCLGSGWLLLLIPLVLIIRFLGRKNVKYRIKQRLP